MTYKDFLDIPIECHFQKERRLRRGIIRNDTFRSGSRRIAMLHRPVHFFNVGIFFYEETLER